MARLFGRDRRAGASLLGSRLWRDFQEHQGAELNGRQSQTPRDLAQLAQDSEMLTPSEIEQVLQNEQEAVTQLVDDAVELLGNATTGTEKAALRQRAQKLSLGARITARLLTKLRLDSKCPPGK